MQPGDLMRAASRLILVWVLVALPEAASSQETGFLNRTLSIDGTDYRYQVYVPREFQRGTPMPIILSLHGGGAGHGNDGLAQTQNGVARAVRLHADRFPAIVVFPQSPRGTPWGHPLGEAIALATLDKTVAEFNGDVSRVYLTGLSGGGYGSWYLSYRHPDRFAALIVICGFIREMTGVVSGMPYPAIVAGTVADPYAAVAQRIARLPVRIFHGDADRAVPVEESRRMAAALKAAGADVQYTEFPGVGHDAWDRAYDTADLFTWLFNQRRR